MLSLWVTFKCKGRVCCIEQEIASKTESKKLTLLSIPFKKMLISSLYEVSGCLFLQEILKKEQQQVAKLPKYLWCWSDHCFNRSLSTAPPLASADTGTGVKVGKASEMGFISR